jgi:hypothetical protein
MARDKVVNQTTITTRLHFLMDLLRVPLLFATAAAIDKAFTAPNPNATDKERVPITNALERFIWAIEIPHAGGREACKV